MADSPIQVVAFDAVGTLIYPWPSVAEIYADIARRYGSKLTQVEIRNRFPAAMVAFDNDSAANNFKTSEVRERELWQAVVTAVLTDVNSIDECFGELFDRFASADAWRMFDDVSETLNLVAARGLRVVIASNLDSRLHPVCDAFEQLRSIKTRCVSAEVGFRKPSRDYYDRLVAMCGCDAQNVLMVGDTPTNDFLGAIDAGLQAVLIDRDKKADLPNRISSLRQIESRLTT